MFLNGLLVGGFIGTAFGFLIAAIFRSKKEADREWEHYE
jgi:hypothetical protein